MVTTRAESPPSTVLLADQSTASVPPRWPSPSILGSSAVTGADLRLASLGPVGPPVDCRSAPAGWQSRSADADLAGRGSKARTGARVELAGDSVRHGDRVLYGQRVDGVVRVTDVPLAAGGRAYLVERGLEEEGTNAHAVLQALIADYLQQAFVLDDVRKSVRSLGRARPIRHRRSRGGVDPGYLPRRT